ncbi:polysaccharide biosynthesis tyrosine autokinase [Chishuiella sp.]|uniref:GumC family protein n=1 Tax=Chishuiella sp. TaxID=1969467 RepID=UPI0028A85097|nr:polysaccharide biosynthesis tyrosine autokinase [Chishuiella sp.]
MKDNNINNNFSDNKEENINIRQIIEQYLFYWKWFVISIFIALFGAFIYLRYTQNQYKVSAKILLNEQKSSTGDLAEVMDQAILGGSSTNSEVGDQIDVIKSNRLLTKVVLKNHLNVKYSNVGDIVTKQIPQENSPISIIFFTNDNQSNQSFLITILSNTKYKLENKKTKDSKTYSFGQKVTIKDESFIITTNGYHTDIINKQLQIDKEPIDATVNNLKNSLSIDPNSDKTSKIINFSIIGAVPEISKKIINDLIDTYNKDILYDNNRLTEATSKFINNRLKIISVDLSGVDRSLEQYKVNNKITDVTSEASIFLESASDNDKNLLTSTTQLQLVDYMNEALSTNKTDLLPTNLGLSDLSITAEIDAYNQLILNKEDMLKSVTKEHPNVVQLQEQINNVKKNLKNSLRIYRTNTQLTVNSIQGKQNQIAGKIQKVPSQERGFRDISRQQQIVESLYLFLLQKREENEIKAAATPENIKVIDFAYENKIPVSPKKSIIYLGALILGFIIPFSGIYIYFLLNNTVKSKEDIEGILNVPVAGEIPQSTQSLVEFNDQSIVSESFRLLRTNINFLLKGDKEAKVICVTSTISGEGKSFISINLAQVLSMSGKSVLLIGGDIRKPKVLEYLGIKDEYINREGISEYLASTDLNVNEIIIQPKNYSFDVIRSGKVPPNPAELLMNGRFKNIIEYGKQHYDYVILDTAPINLVTDTLLVADNADITLYIVRADLLDKNLLAIPKELNEENRLKNMAIVLNDVNLSKGYGNYKYKYSYGERNSYGKNLLKKYLNVNKK